MLAAEERGDPGDRAERLASRREPVGEAFELHCRDVFRYALRRMGDEWEAEEVVAEVFAIAWRRSAELPSEPLPWLYGVARNVVANRQRSGRRRARLQAVLSADVAATGGADFQTHSDDRETAADLLVGLSEADRETLMLTAWEGLAPAEAAEAVGCSAGAFRLRLMRARRRLKRKIDLEKEDLR